MRILAFLIRRSLQAGVVMLAIPVVGVSIDAAPGASAFASYAQLLGDVTRGDLGTSPVSGRPAIEVVLEALAATVELVAVAALVALAVAIPAGVLCATGAGGALPRLVAGVSLVGAAIPVFVTAGVLVWIFGVELGWMPVSGRGATATLFTSWESGLATADGRAHIVLPAVSMAAALLPLGIRRIGAAMAEALAADHVRFARARGLSPARVSIVHALRTALPPIATGGGVGLGAILACAVLTETVFRWPGLGPLFLDAASRGDTPVTVACLLAVGLVFVAVHFLADLVRALIDPGASVPAGAGRTRRRGPGAASPPC